MSKELKDNFKELGQVSNKIFKEIKKSVTEIISDYKTKYDKKMAEKKVADEPKKTANKPQKSAKKDQGEDKKDS